jgi:AcrR family transcriptional regulator
MTKPRSDPKPSPEARSRAAKPKRGDARRNRERLLAAATDAFRDADEQVSLEAIARRAGVGIGTLYRHFPAREDLVEAVYLSELDRLVASAPDLLADRPPDLALRAWMDRFVDWVAGKQGMVETLRAMFASGALVRSAMQERLVATIAGFLDAGAAARSLREDVEPADVLRSLIGLITVGGAGPDHSSLDRTLDLLVDGLRHRHDR